MTFGVGIYFLKSYQFTSLIIWAYAP